MTILKTVLKNNSHSWCAFMLALVVLWGVLPCFVFAQGVAPQDKPAVSPVAASLPPGVQLPESLLPSGDAFSPMDLTPPAENLETRFARKITLDVRDMNVIDVIKFLAMKGEFNVVINKTVTGRATLYLKSVSIKDALDIILISNSLAYSLENDILYVMTGVEYETMYGKKFSDKIQVDIVHLKYAKPSYILAALDNLKSALGKIVIDEDTGSVVMMDTPQVIAKMKDIIGTMENPMKVFVYDLQYAKADVVVEKMRPRLDAQAVGSITADERSNKVIIRALPGRREEVEALIKELDVKTKEVLIEARVIQIVFKPNFDYGIDWDFNFRDSPDQELKKLSFQNLYSNANIPSTAFTKIAAGNIAVDAFQATVKALKQVSDTKILSNPKILVTNNEEAKIHIGDTIPYIISTTSGTGDNAITSEDVRFVDVGLQLLVTPTINDNGFVTMRLKPEISTVVALVQSKGGGIPQINKTEVETTVMVKDGTSIILGGLKKEDKAHTKRGFPLLMDIPYLGKMFSQVSDSVNSTEIVIFITPHIVSGEEDFTDWRGTIKPLKGYDGNKDLRK